MDNPLLFKFVSKRELIMCLKVGQSSLAVRFLRKKTRKGNWCRSTQSSGRISLLNDQMLIILDMELLRPGQMKYIDVRKMVSWNVNENAEPNIWPLLERMHGWQASSCMSKFPFFVICIWHFDFVFRQTLMKMLSFISDPFWKACMAGRPALVCRVSYFVFCIV